MADLLVRGVEDHIVQELKRRAGAHGRSAEAEHRAILAAALLTPARRNLSELLASMPDVGLDADFIRQDDNVASPHFFVDTNVISEARKGERADPGVNAFWQQAASNDSQIVLAAVTVGEWRRGVELIRHRRDRQ